jgi:hypothetical protein
MLQEIISDLKDIDAAIVGVEASRAKHPVLGESEGNNWKADESIKSSLAAIIRAGNAVSDNCTKLVLFIPTKPKEHELDSLLTETRNFMQALFCEYMWVCGVLVHACLHVFAAGTYHKPVSERAVLVACLAPSGIISPSR